MSQHSQPPSSTGLRVGDLLRSESVGGILLLVAAVLAVGFANSGLQGVYFGVRDSYLGGELFGLDLRLSLGHWAADGLLAVFFFLAGLELKQEFVAGALRRPARAILPVAAAFGGVAVPAIIYVLMNLGNPDGLRGWAIPTATDIAFAMAVLAVIGSSLPVAMRTFLLTLAIVDDLIAITIIATFYTSELSLGHLFGSLGVIIIYGLVANLSERWLRSNLAASWFVLLPIGIVAWALLLNSGVHATIAGVLLAFMVPVHPRGRKGRAEGLAHRLEHHIRPLAGVCVPVFAFFSAGVAVGGWSGLPDRSATRSRRGSSSGWSSARSSGSPGRLLCGHPLPGCRVEKGLAWIDILGLAAIGGIGFTVLRWSAN